MAAILKEILDRVEMPQQTADARLLSILCDEADKSMILQLEADELIPYSVLAETGNAIKKVSRCTVGKDLSEICT